MFESLRRNPSVVWVRSGQKKKIDIIYIVLQTSVHLFLKVSVEIPIQCNTIPYHIQQRLISKLDFEILLK